MHAKLIREVVRRMNCASEIEGVMSDNAANQRAFEQGQQDFRPYPPPVLWEQSYESELNIHQK